MRKLYRVVFKVFIKEETVFYFDLYYVKNKTIAKKLAVKNILNSSTQIDENTFKLNDNNATLTIVGVYDMTKSNIQIDATTFIPFTKVIQELKWK